MTSSEFTHSLAIVIGINDYDNGISPLKTAAPDAEAIAHLLTTKHGYQVRLLLNQDATLAKLKQLLQKLPNEIEPGDRLLFYFAGHGVALNNENGPAGYLVPQDAASGDSDTLLSMLDLHDALVELPCRHLLAVLDCCFSGAFRWSSLRDIVVEAPVVYRERYDRFVRDPAWQVLTSSAYDQRAWDILNETLADHRGRGKTGRHSPFAEALMDALEGAADRSPVSPNGQQGDGVVTATELYLYLRDRIEPATEDSPHRQTPGLWHLRKHDKGEYVFLVPGHELNLPDAPPLDASNNPYRGLESFEPEHADLFFGRGHLIQQLQTFVGEHSLTVVLGASGTGKSSLVKAGLIPCLQDSGHSKWEILPVVRPGESPLQSLTSSVQSLLKRHALPLDQLNAKSPPASEGEGRSPSLRDALQRSSHQLAAIAALWKRLYPNVRLLLVIDQFEELITLCRDKEERQQFLSLLEGAIASAPSNLRLILTLRSDFEPLFLSSILQSNWMQSRFIVPPMTQDELRQAIEGPAVERVIYFEPHDLVDRIINEVVQMPGALPLLSFTLSELYLKYLERRSDNRALTAEDYEALGGVVGSLTQRADQEYHQLLADDPAYASTIRHVMLRMITISGGEAARRRVLDSELIYPDPESQRVEAVIQRFTAARLLVQGQDASGGTYIEPAHDALVQGWEKLQHWQTDEQETLALQRLLTPAAKDWAVRSQKPGLLWNANDRLDSLQRILNSADSWLNELEIKFIRRSIYRRRFNRWSIRGIVMAIALGSSAAAITFFIQGLQIRRGDIENLVALSDARWLTNNQLDALLASVRAGQRFDQLRRVLSEPVLQSINYVTDFGSLSEIQTSVAANLNQVLAQIQEQHRWDAHDDVIHSTSFSPDGKLIASASADGTVKLWDRRGNLYQSISTDDGVRAVTFSPDSQTVALTNYDGRVRLWNLAGEEIETLHHDAIIHDLAYSRNGQLLAAASDTGEIKLWHLESGESKVLQGHLQVATSVSFSPDNQLLASASWDRTVKIWNMAGQEPQLVQTINGHDSRVMAVTFSPDGQTLASADETGTVKHWSLAGEQRHAWSHGGEVTSVQFKSDGQVLASTGQNGVIKIWQVADGTLVTELRGHAGPVTDLSFSPDNRLLASAGWDMSIRLWNLDETQLGQAVKYLEGHDDHVAHVAFNPQKQILASASLKHLIKLWSYDGTPIADLEGHRGQITDIAFSPDGELLASASQDRTIRLWDTSSGEHQAWIAHPDLESRITISFSSGGQVLASASDDGTVKLWSLDGDLLETPIDQEQPIRLIRFNPDAQIFATLGFGDEDNVIRLWRRDGTLIDSLEGHEETITDLEFNPNDRTLASASREDGIIKVWSITGEELRSWKAHDDVIHSISFSEDGQILASAGDDGTVRLWNSEGDRIKILRKRDASPILDVSFSRNLDHPQIAATHGSTVVLWNLDLNTLLETGCNWLDSYQECSSGN